MSDAYDFAAFFATLDADWYDHDELLKRLLTRHTDVAAAEVEEALRTTGARAAGPLRALAEASALPESAPRLRHFDARGRRLDAIDLPASTHEALRLASGVERLGSVGDDPFLHYARVYLVAQNGEAGVACSLACTDGLVRALDALGENAEHELALTQVRGSTAERYWHGAQFVTEVQGGSDVPANVLRAEPCGDWFRLHGRKWFCSNVNADYFLVTARPDGAPAGGRGVGLFLVPARVDPMEPWRNGYTIDRLKDKLGTRELATAEVTFAGARAWPVGPLDRGIANLLAHVLVPSRVACVLFAAAALRRAERIAGAYAGFREAFGHRIAEFPLVQHTLEQIRIERARALAAALELVRMWNSAGSSDGPTAALDFRIMLSLCKAVLTRRATMRVHDAMMVLAGNGVEERFSPLPRLYRDSVIMETWEGPYALLIDQTLRDLRRYEVDARTFITRVAGADHAGLTEQLAHVIDASDTRALARLADLLVDAFADQALTAAAGIADTR